jgi:chemotaxis protein CheX
VDVSIINPFLSATVNLFENMFAIEAQAGAPFLLEVELNHRWELSGLLGVTGGYQGIVAVRFPKMLADKMLQKSGVETKTEEERLDTLNGMVGELTNIVAGNAATALADVRIEISPPVVILGKNHRIAWPRNMPVIGIPFSTPNGPFEVDVCFKR